MNNIIHYIFGFDLVVAYNLGGTIEVVREIQRDDSLGCLYKYDPDENHPSNLLHDFSGWGDYTEITKEEYEIIENSFDEL